MRGLAAAASCTPLLRSSDNFKRVVVGVLEWAATRRRTLESGDLLKATSVSGAAVRAYTSRRGVSFFQIPLLASPGCGVDSHSVNIHEPVLYKQGIAAQRNRRGLRRQCRSEPRYHRSSPSCSLLSFHRTLGNVFQFFAAPAAHRRAHPSPGSPPRELVFIGMAVRRTGKPLVAPIRAGVSDGNVMPQSKSRLRAEILVKTCLAVGYATPTKTTTRFNVGSFTRTCRFATLRTMATTTCTNADRWTGQASELVRTLKGLRYVTYLVMGCLAVSMATQNMFVSALALVAVLCLVVEQFNIYAKASARVAMAEKHLDRCSSRTCALSSPNT